MAIEVFSEISSAGISPRISFSYNLNNAEAIEEHHQRLDTSLLDSSSDFDFSIGNRFVQELSSADELFSNGKILPIGIKKEPVVVAKEVHRNQPPRQQIATESTDNKNVKKRLKEYLSMSIDDTDDHKPASKSFWQFKRCSSESSTRSKSLIRSLDQFLSRSKSTGSAPNPKPTTVSKESQKQQPSLSRKSSVSSSSSSGAFYTYGNYTQKPPLNNCGAYGNGVRVSSVLNLPHPLISNATVGLFGSRFCNGKVKRKKR